MSVPMVTRPKTKVSYMSFPVIVLSVLFHVSGGQFGNIGGSLSGYTAPPKVVDVYQDGLDIVRQELQSEDDTSSGTTSPVITTNFTCDQYHFKCASQDKCIWYANVCDTSIGCPDGSDEDELFCQTRSCPSLDYFRCNNGQCLKKYAICEGVHRYSNCVDRSEVGNVKCSKCPTVWAGVNANLFQCTTGECVYNSSVCNGVIDCPDNSDEAPELCGASTTTPNTTTTSNNTTTPNNINLQTSGTIIVAATSSDLGSLVGIGLGATALLLVMAAIVTFFCYKRLKYRCCVRFTNQPRFGLPPPNGTIATAQSKAVVSSSGMFDRPPMPLPRSPDTDSSGYQSVIYTKDGYVKPSPISGGDTYTIHYDNGNKPQYERMESNIYTQIEGDYNTAGEDQDIRQRQEADDDTLSNQDHPYLTMQGVPPNARDGDDIVTVTSA